MTAHELLQYYKGRQAAIVDAIREIVEIESPSHDAIRNREVVDWVEQRVRETGVEVEITRTSVDDGDHIVIRAFAGDGKHLMLLGHTDTVHPVGTNLQNPTRTDADRFYGCGIFDMKANIVLMLEALRYFAVTGTRPARPITILLSCDEEVGSHTGREMVEREAANAEHCLVFEPSDDGRVKTGRKGTGWYTLKAHGIPAHAGLEPEKGANSIVEIARQIERINQLGNASIGTTVNVCTIKGGTTSNVIPEHTECEIDVRFSSMAEAERVDTAIRSLTSIDERVTLELLGGINRPRWNARQRSLHYLKKHVTSPPVSATNSAKPKSAVRRMGILSLSWACRFWMGWASRVRVLIPWESMCCLAILLSGQP